MPSRNVRKEFVAGSVYHVYNRGVEKSSIFYDESDYGTFLNLIKLRLLPTYIPDYLQRFAHFNGRIRLHAFCLMPNHFHLLVWQGGERDLALFMQSLVSSYVGYFNKRYDRVGHLFQGPYKAAMVRHNNQIERVISYIHQNPLNPAEYPYSSYGYYTGIQRAEWVDTLVVGPDIDKARPCI